MCAYFNAWNCKIRTILCHSYLTEAASLFPRSDRKKETYGEITAEEEANEAQHSDSGHLNQISHHKIKTARHACFNLLIIHSSNHSESFLSSLVILTWRQPATAGQFLPLWIWTPGKLISVASPMETSKMSKTGKARGGCYSNPWNCPYDHGRLFHPITRDHGYYWPWGSLDA